MKLHWSLPVATAGVIIGSALYFSVPANADSGVQPYVSRYALPSGPAMCEVLDEYPSVSCVSGVLRGIQDNSGFTTYQAGQVVAIGVESGCPRHLPLLRLFVAAAAPTNPAGGTTI